MKINLPDVTLVALTGKGYKTEEHKEAIRRSCEGIEFGAVKLIELDEIKDIDSWNKAVIYELPKYVETSHCLFIHGDGYVINPTMWKDEWLQYDFAGSPWPLPKDDFSYRDEEGELVRVGNSIGLRSKKLLDLIATREWKSYYGFSNEDGFITCHNRKWLESQGCKFMPFEEAIYFGKETVLPENYNVETFLFHSL